MTTYCVMVASLMVVLSFMSLGSAKVYTVGDSAGWALSVDYNTWASDKTFNVGDSLVFNYDSSHTVDLVSSSDYSTCAIGNSIASYNSGTTNIALNTTGSHYFVCGVMGHCVGGMKLTVNVTSDGSPSASPSPVTADSPTNTPFGTTLPPPTLAGTNNNPAESSSPTVSPFVAVVFSLVALILVSILG
ncbi:hypothetical protein SSX86_008568 [Deinandra increscens subsp. villosa]|uniref:Phytocyanin domain-containing protein n=1 Tax=Deinandra increscens subsp. villosa TaxID=3103831 RepID=A0AAP0H4N2_9ASTR